MWKGGRGHEHCPLYSPTATAKRSRVPESRIQQESGRIFCDKRAIDLDKETETELLDFETEPHTNAIVRHHRSGHPPLLVGPITKQLEQPIDWMDSTTSTTTIIESPGDIDDGVKHPLNISEQVRSWCHCEVFEKCVLSHDICVDLVVVWLCLSILEWGRNSIECQMEHSHGQSL